MIEILLNDGLLYLQKKRIRLEHTVMTGVALHPFKFYEIRGKKVLYVALYFPFFSSVLYHYCNCSLVRKNLCLDLKTRS
jgi:hypothetical protein